MKLLSFLSIGLISILACGTHVKSSLGYKMYEIGSSSSKDNDLVSKLQEQNLEIQRLQKQNSKLKLQHLSLTQKKAQIYSRPKPKDAVLGTLRKEIDMCRTKLHREEDQIKYIEESTRGWYKKYIQAESSIARLQAELALYNDIVRVSREPEILLEAEALEPASSSTAR